MPVKGRKSHLEFRNHYPTIILYEVTRRQDKASAIREV